MKKIKKIELKEVTPKAYQCIIGACPSVFKSNKNTYIFIGKKVSNYSKIDILSKKVGKDETVVELPEEIIIGLLKDLHLKKMG